MGFFPNIRYNIARRRTLFQLLVIAPLGLFLKLYSPPGSWVHDSGAGVLYEIFWIYLFFIVWPGRLAIHRVPVGVFVGTCVLEVSQLVETPFLESLRSSFVGVSLIGETFAWWDFPHYAAGCLIGWLGLRLSVMNERDFI
ncbi:MAG: DUF2809 domain-containing protein [Candidatus Omnitrophota bacterium]|nr:DUF2809 domain-containing protein [Candidatus Omnitrophota bacterium]